MLKPHVDALRDLQALRNSAVAAWLREVLEDTKAELTTQRDMDILRTLQGRAQFLSSFLGYVDDTHKILTAAGTAPNPRKA